MARSGLLSDRAPRAGTVRRSGWPCTCPGSVVRARRSPIGRGSGPRAAGTGREGPSTYPGDRPSTVRGLPLRAGSTRRRSGKRSRSGRRTGADPLGAEILRRAVNAVRFPEAIVEVRDAVASAHGLLVVGALGGRNHARPGRGVADGHVAKRSGRAVGVAGAPRGGRGVDAGERRDGDVGARARRRCAGDRQRDEHERDDPFHCTSPRAKTGCPSAVNVRPASNVGLTRHGARTVLGRPSPGRRRSAKA